MYHNASFNTANQMGVVAQPSTGKNEGGMQSSKPTWTPWQDPVSNKANSSRLWTGKGSVVQCSPSMAKALGSVPSTMQNKV